MNFKIRGIKITFYKQYLRIYIDTGLIKIHVCTHAEKIPICAQKRNPFAHIESRLVGESYNLFAHILGAVRTPGGVE